MWAGVPRPPGLAGERRVLLIDRIEKTFGVGPAPPEPIVEPEYLRPGAQGDQGATNYFLGKRWKGLDADALRHHRAAMYMFTPRAHHYYFPAFMSVALDSAPEADDLPDLIIYHLSLHHDLFWWERIRLFDPPQCDVIAEFVEVVSDDTHRDSGETIRALAALERARRGV
jgi:hypothetical protein